ncbi:regulatory protein RecX [Gemmatimonas sp.]|uniref:regulatory protein RecX n=1 Tax=Gemmatimonas sp. TaxID=1962908 RepID=UPI003569565B
MKTVLESSRRPGRFVVTLADGRVFTIAIGAVSETGATRPGVELDADAVAYLARESQITDVSDRAVNALARGRKTRRELEIRLRRRQPDAVLIAEALDRLAASGILSDEDVAHAEAAARLRRGEAPAKVRQVLRRKGVEGKMVNEAVSAAISEDGFDELTACRALAEKRVRALGAKEPAVLRRRLFAFLQRRGFGGSIIGQVLREVLGRPSDDETE